MSTRWLQVVVGGALAVSGAVASAEAPDGRGWSLEGSVLEVDSSVYRETVWPYQFSGEDRRGFALKGSYAFTRHFALQAGYYDFGEQFAPVSPWTCPPGRVCATLYGPPVPPMRADIEGLSFAAVGTWHVTEKVELFGKLGVFRGELEVAPSSVVVSPTLDDRDSDVSDVLRGAGVGVWLTPRWRLDVQYERVDIDVKSAGVGATYRF